MISLVFDMNNLAVRNYFAKDIGADTPNPDIKLWKFRIIESIYKSLSKEDDVNEVVLAVDDKQSWRKLYWNRYKEKREEQRKESKVDWRIFFKEFELLSKEIHENLPFKIFKIQSCEADDIIAVICLERQNNYTIISNDEDFIQLVSERVKLYNPSKMMYITYDNTEQFIIGKCLTGQQKDGIFNIITPLDHPADKRKPGFGEESAKKVMAEGYEGWLKKKGLEKRFHTNRVLIDFKLIPQTIKTRILNTYDNYVLPDPSHIYTFFKKNNFKGFLDDYDKVENQFMRFYR